MGNPVTENLNSGTVFQRQIKRLSKITTLLHNYYSQYIFQCKANTQKIWSFHSE